MRRLVLIAGVAFALLAATACAASDDRFEGFVGGAVTGRGHHFVVGDGLNLVFVDRKASDTPYTVCWHKRNRAKHRCWSGRTGIAGKQDRIFTAAPGALGTFLVEWSVGGRRAASWRFVNGVGD